MHCEPQGTTRLCINSVHFLIELRCDLPVDHLRKVILSHVSWVLSIQAHTLILELIYIGKLPSMWVLPIQIFLEPWE